MKRLSIAALTVVVLFSWALLAFGLEVPPRPSGPITDLSETLTREEIKSLEFKVADLSRTIGTPIAILLIPALAGDSLEDYFIRLTEKWKIGKDNGVIMLLVLDERMARIHVGASLKGELPDALTKTIASEKIGPPLRNGDFYGAIDQGLLAIKRAYEGNAPLVTGLIIMIMPWVLVIIIGKMRKPCRS